ncbi:hypothetical protein D9758_005355 [Tetrapyrgos nigripes]|uniref:Uncharacterized protein n=1 Tax=Tetrapyrgos nigripes TaxID=182062 RepID=A0A8H5LPY2_9AGAR|nr:hypothetical protein D9758_005355 [Tetrapyrgos nigripes]
MMIKSITFYAFSFPGDTTLLDAFLGAGKPIPIPEVDAAACYWDVVMNPTPGIDLDIAFGTEITRRREELFRTERIEERCISAKEAEIQIRAKVSCLLSLGTEEHLLQALGVRSAEGSVDVDKAKSVLIRLRRALEEEALRMERPYECEDELRQRFLENGVSVCERIVAIAMRYEQAEHFTNTTITTVDLDSTAMHSEQEDSSSLSSSSSFSTATTTSTTSTFGDTDSSSKAFRCYPNKDNTETGLFSPKSRSWRRIRQASCKMLGRLDCHCRPKLQPKGPTKMDSLPLDTSHPAVRDYLALIRLQVLTPLSLLINIATVIVCSVLVSPSISGISTRHPTSISPRPMVIAVYVAALYIGQIGYCVLLVLARKMETKRTLIKGVGLSLVLANWVMALWAIAWVFEWFLTAIILQGILLLLLLYSNIVLLIYHKPTSQRPFDTLLIHAPMRFFLVLEIAMMFPLGLFIELGLTDGIPVGGAPTHRANPWPAFGVVLGTNFIGMLVVIMRRDIVWCVAATWICISIWSLKPKPAPVFQRREGRVALPGDGTEHPGLYNRNSTRGQARVDGNANAGPREVDAEAVWGQ